MNQPRVCERIKLIFGNDKFRITILLIGYFVFLLIWTMRQSYNNCPDENMRFQMPKYIFEHGELPTLFDESIRDERYGFSYAHHPSLPYVIGAIFMRIAAMLGVGDGHLYMAARMVSVLSGVVFLFLLIKISDLVFDNKISKLTMIGLLMFWPQLCFVFTYVNCDSLSLVGVGIIILSWAKGIKSKWAIKHCVLLAAGMIIVTLSYINGTGFVFISALVFILSYIYCNKDDKKYKTMVIRGSIVCGLVLVLAGWFFIRNYLLYNSFLGLNIADELSNKYAIEGFTAIERKAYTLKALTCIPGLTNWFITLDFSFFGRFGWMDIGFSSIVYYLVLLIEIVLIILAIKRIIRQKKIKSASKKILELGLFGGAIVTFIYVIRYSLTDFQPQGRYMMPMVISFGYFMTVGIDELRYITNKKMKFLCYAIPIVLFLVDIYAIAFMIK